jgi:hypothetical protein
VKDPEFISPVLPKKKKKKDREREWWLKSKWYYGVGERANTWKVVLLGMFLYLFLIDM